MMSPLSSFASQGLLRLAPGDDLGDLGVREEPEDGDVLASSAGDLAAPPVYGRPLHLAVVAVAKPARGLLNVGAGALEVAAVEDGPLLLTGGDHLVHIGELRADGLVGGDAAHARPGPRR